MTTIGEQPKLGTFGVPLGRNVTLYRLRIASRLVLGRAPLTVCHLALLSACSDRAVTAPAGLVAASLARSAAAPSRPISGRCETVFTETPLDPTHAHVIVRGTCRLEYLGRSTVFIDQIPDFAASTLTGVTIYTAANGDELRSTGSVQILTPPDAAGNSTFAGPHSFTGGTGRFAHASGGYTFTGRANLVTFTGFFEIVGTIAFAASERGGP